MWSPPTRAPCDLAQLTPASRSLRRESTHSVSGFPTRRAPRPGPRAERSPRRRPLGACAGGEGTREASRMARPGGSWCCCRRSHRGRSGRAASAYLRPRRRPAAPPPPPPPSVPPRSSRVGRSGRRSRAFSPGSGDAPMARVARRGAGATGSLASGTELLLAPPTHAQPPSCPLHHGPPPETQRVPPRQRRPRPPAPAQLRRLRLP